MKEIIIPDKEKCPSNGYTVKHTKGVIDEICTNPNDYPSHMFMGVINSALIIYKYSGEYITYEWIKNVINSLNPYIE